MSSKVWLWFVCATIFNVSAFCTHVFTMRVGMVVTFRARSSIYYLMCDDSIHLQLPRQLRLLDYTVNWIHALSHSSFSQFYNVNKIERSLVDKIERGIESEWGEQNQSEATTIELLLVAHNVLMSVILFVVNKIRYTFDWNTFSKSF